MAEIIDKVRHRKAFTYTAAICATILLLFFLISWKVLPPAPPLVQDEMEINLGNNNDGFGEEQPLIKGEQEPTVENTPAQQANQATAPQQAEEENAVTAEPDAPDDAAPVPTVAKKPSTTKAETPTEKPTTKPVTKPIIATNASTVTKPKTPKIIMNGPGKGGGNSTEDNGYTMQGNTKGSTGDNGDTNGNKDSYGNKPGGKVGGAKVISGNRKFINYYSFTGELPKATINAVIKVSAAGVGNFIKIGQGSTSFSRDYANAIIGYLRNINFNKDADESTVTVQFNFNVQ